MIQRIVTPSNDTTYRYTKQQYNVSLQKLLSSVLLVMGCSYVKMLIVVFFLEYGDDVALLQEELS